MRLSQKLFLLFIFPLFVKSQGIPEPIARYLFNSNAHDEKGKNNGRAYGVTPTEDRFGNENSALYLQGNYDSYINLGSSNELKPAQGSISFWIKLDHIMNKGTGVESIPIIFTRSHSRISHNEAYYMGCEMNMRNIGCCASTSENDQVSLYSKTVLSLRKWHHLVLTYDDQYFCIYIDGVLEAKALKNFKSIFLPGDSIIVGNRVSEKNNRFFNGSVGDLAIYNKALSSDEIIGLFNAPNPNKRALFFQYIATAFALLLLLACIAWLVKKRINKVLANETKLLHKSYNQEIRVLKAQMSPHFIFNSLNSILQFIVTSENEKAELYLTRFSKLMRKLLESNTKESISLTDELFILNGYIEIESLRFNNVFNYTVEIDETLKDKSINIPHFLIQPFIENAIWHGLLRKKGDKELLLSFRLQEPGIILCTIDDNGIGRKNVNSERPFEKEKSLAIDFVIQRLELISKMKKIKLGISIIDKTDSAGESAGTTIHLLIPIMNV